jgi:hypothetical protein
VKVFTEIAEKTVCDVEINLVRSLDLFASGNESVKTDSDATNMVFGRG